MIKFLQENWFKVIIAVGTGIVTCSITYYYILFLPYQAKVQDEHRLQMECRSLGEKINKEINPPDNPLMQIPHDPVYYYNQELGKCFYYGGYDDHMAMFQTIIDAYSNKDIISVRQYINAEFPTEGSLEEFTKKKAELFNEK